MSDCKEDFLNLVKEVAKDEKIRKILIDSAACLKEEDFQYVSGKGELVSDIYQNLLNGRDIRKISCNVELYRSKTEPGTPEYGALNRLVQFALDACVELDIEDDENFRY